MKTKQNKKTKNKNKKIKKIKKNEGENLKVTTTKPPKKV